MSPDPLLPVAGQRERLPGGVNPAADLRFFIGKHARRPRTDLEWFRHGEAAVLLEACQALKPRWAAFLLVCFTGGLRWGEATALHVGDIDWSRSRLHVQRTWSEDGGRIERTKDGEDRWVKLPASALEALRTQVEAMALEAQLNRWTHEQRRLVFPNGIGKVTRYGAFSEHVWRPLLTATKLPYRKPQAMRHSYATWLLEGGADIRWVQRQFGHATIAQTSDTYGHLESDRHEERVNLDEVLTPKRVPPRPNTSHPPPPEPRPNAQLLRIIEGEMVVEGKGFVDCALNSDATLARTT